MKRIGRPEKRKNTATDLQDSEKRLTFAPAFRKGASLQGKPAGGTETVRFRISHNPRHLGNDL